MCFDDRDIGKVKKPIMLYKIAGVFRIGYDCLVTVAMLACGLYTRTLLTSCRLIY